ncbi:MAG: MFS transporter [Chloroflexi bacterium]|nr:MFS transporter [Chloroflexota bacterium]
MTPEPSIGTRARWWTFGIVCLALFMAMLDNLVVITALPSIRRALGASVSDLEWTVNAYTLAFATLMMTGSALGDRFGRKRVFVIGVALFTVGSALAALSGGATQLVASRAVQGVGAALVTPLTLTILTGVFPAEQRAAAIGLWSGISGLGLAIGPLVGGAIINGFPWNSVFWLNVPVGALVVALAWMRLEESRGERRPLDLPGLFLAGLGLLGVVFGLVRGNALGWGSTPIVASLAAGAVLLLAFLARERLAGAPMLDLALFRERAFSAANTTGFLMSAGMFGSIMFLTLYVQEVLHASPLRAGLETMPWTGTIMLVAPLAGLLAGRIGPRPVATLGMLAQGAALLWIGMVSTATSHYTDILPAFILGGLGMGLTFAPLSESVMAAVSVRHQGQASGSYNAIRELGGVFGIAILGAVFQHVTVSPLRFMDGFHAASFVGAAIVLAGAAIATLLPGAAPASQPAIEPATAEAVA